MGLETEETVPLSCTVAEPPDPVNAIVPLDWVSVTTALVLTAVKSRVAVSVVVDVGAGAPPAVRVKLMLGMVNPFDAF